VLLGGALAARRAGRPLAAWAGVPAVVAGSILALLLVAARWEKDLAKVEILRTAVLAPSGAGTEWSSATVHTLGGGGYGLRLPWRDARLSEVNRPHRFGNPFSRAPAVVRLRHDQESGMLAVDDLAVGPLGWGRIKFYGAIHRPTVRVERRDEALWLVNTTGETVARASFCSHEGSAHLEAWPPGAAHRVDPASGQPSALEGMAEAELRGTCAAIGPGGFVLLASGTGAASAGLAVAPPLPTIIRWADLVLGPLPDPTP
jgi:hypothetical protein